MKDFELSLDTVEEIKKFSKLRPLGIPEKGNMTEHEYMEEVHMRRGEKRLLETILAQHPEEE